MTESTLDLLISCLSYLSFRSRQLEVERKDIVSNILVGKYRLQAVASTTWLPLVRRYLRYAHAPDDLEALNTLLHNFASELSDPEFLQHSTSAKATSAAEATEAAKSQPAGSPLNWKDAPEFIRYMLTSWKDRAEDVWTCDNGKTMRPMRFTPTKLIL
jgi:hypothetical protein